MQCFLERVTLQGENSFFSIEERKINTFNLKNIEP